MRTRAFAWAAPLVGLVAAACGSGSTDGADTTYTREKLLDPQTCKECHQDHFREWSGSMHAYASKDPVFLAMNARGQKETGGALGNFCVNCHAPLAVQEGKVKGGTGIESAPEELQGITCYFCHQVTGVHGSFNNPLDLANDTTMRGGIRNPVKNPAHRAEYSVLHDSLKLESAKMCGSCHDIVVPAHFSGAAEDVHLEKTYEEWQTSLFSKPTNKTPESCTSSGCHMPTDLDVPVANPPGLHMPTRPARHHHEFAGVDVALTDFPEKPAQAKAVRALLEQTMAMKLCVSAITGKTTVTIENITAGHNVPSGASQDRRMWVELHAYDQSGERFSSGEVPGGTAVTALKDPNLWLFRDVTLDRNGQPAHMFWDVASVDTKSDQKTIRAPETLDATAPNWHVELVSRTYDTMNGGRSPVFDRVWMTVHLQPIGRDVLENLFPGAAGDGGPQDPGGVLGAMPTYDLVPNKGDGGITTTLLWTPALAKAEGTTEGDSRCVQTGTLR
jgi:nitrate/TMAO reductase-like tetraheme cytochrome c subunit